MHKLRQDVLQGLLWPIVVIWQKMPELQEQGALSSYKSIRKENYLKGQVTRVSIWGMRTARRWYQLRGPYESLEHELQVDPSEMSLQ